MQLRNTHNSNIVDVGWWHVVVSRDGDVAFHRLHADFGCTNCGNANFGCSAGAAVATCDGQRGNRSKRF